MKTSKKRFYFYFLFVEYILGSQSTLFVDILRDQVFGKMFEISE